MNSKKILIIVMAVVIFAIIGVFVFKGIGNNRNSNSILLTTKNPITMDTTDNGAEKSIGRMTDDIYVEILAHVTYYEQEDSASWTKYAEDLFKKYDITKENIIAYGEALNQDHQHATEIAQKYEIRLAELQNTEK